MSDIKIDPNTSISNIDGINMDEIPSNVNTFSDFITNYKAVKEERDRLNNTLRNPKPVDAYSDASLLSDPKIASVIQGNEDSHQAMNEALKAAGIPQRQRDAFLTNLLSAAAPYVEEQHQLEQQWIGAMNQTYGDNAQEAANIYEHVTGQPAAGVDIENIIYVVDQYSANNTDNGVDPNQGYANDDGNGQVPAGFVETLPDGSSISIDPTNLDHITGLAHMKTKDADGNILDAMALPNIKALHARAKAYFTDVQKSKMPH